MLKSDRYLITGLAALGVVAWIVSLYNKANAVDASQVKLTDVVDLRSKYTLQDARIDALVDLITTRDAAQLQQFQAAVFEPTSEGFERIDTTLGSFAVSIKNVVPYGDGTKLTINIGNPMAASFDGVKLQIEYQRKIPAGSNFRPDPLTKEQQILKQVRAGSWNPNSVLLPGIKPEDMQYIKVKMSANLLYLSP